MNSNYHDDSKSSSEESDRSEKNDDMGTGRSYECVFCKRGFTTAQALGGHMNIHRKDRIKARPSSLPSVSSRADENHGSLKSYLPIQSYQPHYSTAPEVNANYQISFPASTWNLRPTHTQHIDELPVQNPRRLNLFEEDWQRSLRMQVDPKHVDDDGEKGEDGSEEDEVDLELRLGHYP